MPAGLTLEDFDAQLTTPRTPSSGPPAPQASRYEVYSIGAEFTVVCKFAAGHDGEQAEALRAGIVAGVEALAEP